MSQIILGAIALLGVLWLMKGFTKGNPTAMSRMLRKAGGLAVIGVGGLLLIRGRIDAGIPLIVLGLGIGGWTPSMAGIPGFSTAKTSKTPGQVSRARTAMIEVELEIDTGAMRGTVLAGRYAGKALDSLSMEDFKAFYIETGADPDGRSVLEAYLDRRFPTWREDFQQDTAAGAGKRARPSSAMTKEEAYQILGVQPGASVEDIRTAHRSLMKKLHPDQGGSTYLAARVNEAKDILLGSHG